MTVIHKNLDAETTLFVFQDGTIKGLADWPLAENDGSFEEAMRANGFTLICHNYEQAFEVEIFESFRAGNACRFIVEIDTKCGCNTIFCPALPDLVDCLRYFEPLLGLGKNVRG